MTRSKGWVKPIWTLVNILTQYEQIFLAGFDIGRSARTLMIRKIHTGGLAGCLAGLLPLALLVITGMQTAEAKECSVAQPSGPQGHWSYRLIDGRKCWYQGENNFPKSLLQWPEQASALSAFGKAEPNADETQLLSKTQGTSGKANDRPDKDSESFETRWRGLEPMR
jgi:hypothetical protein